jgi:hypothetical protein
METLRELLQITEARDPKLVYDEKPVNKKVGAAIDKVTLALSGNQSGKFTKVSREFSRLKTAAEKLSERQNKLNAYIKDEALALFDAEDEIYSRIIETVSMTISISKKTVTTSNNTDFEKVIEGLLVLVPDLKSQIEELIKVNTTIKTAERSPALRVTVKEGLDFKAFKALIKTTFSGIKSWARSFDRKLSKLQQLADKI